MSGCMSIRILSVALTLLVIVSGRQYSEIRDLRGRLADCALSSRRAAADTMEGQGTEIARALMWLHQYYQAADGLQRPNGLWIGDHPDYDGIAVWIFDVYLTNRLKGRTETEAKTIVEDRIKRSDEWRSKHRTRR